MKSWILGLILLILTGAIIYGVMQSLKNKHGFDNDSDWNRHDSKLKKIEQRKKTLSQQIKSSMGKGVCREDSHCHVVGLGAKVCEGYSNFLVYSSLDTSEPDLLNLVESFNEADEEFNKISVNVFHCGEKAKQVRCHEKRCTVYE